MRCPNCRQEIDMREAMMDEDMGLVFAAYPKGSFRGNSLAIVANRISYLLGLRGPSLSVDTACSSSLVSVMTCGVKKPLSVVAGWPRRM